ncbi:20 kDa chaperonin, chloroplastic [Linum perenne]
MAATQLTASSVSISPRSLASFNPSTAQFASFPTLKPARSLRGLVVQAATLVAPKIKKGEETTSGGIFLPDSAQTKPQGGEVVAVGKGKTVGDKTVEISVKAGSQVVYSKYAGTEVEFDGTSHLIMKEDDIVGVLETDDVKDLKPLSDRVYIKVAEAEDKTAGGLILAASSKEKPSIGTVVAVGPGSLDDEGNRTPVPVSPGNTVLYSKYAGNDFKGNDGTNYIALRVSDVMAVLS